MFVYLKRLRDWKTLGKAQVMNYDTPVWSNDNQTGSMVVADLITPEHVGAALITEDARFGWIIKSVKPQEDGISITLADFINAFDRSVIYAVPSSGGSMKFIADVLKNEFNNCSDAEYKVKLTASGDTSSDFLAPDILEGNLFNPADYIRKLVRSGVRLTVNFILLQLQFSKPIKRYNVPFDDGHTQLGSVEISKNRVAKVTSIVGSTRTNYYLQEDGTVGTTAPSPRIAGEWRMLVPNESEDIAVQVKNIFAANSESHQLDFYSDRELDWGGEITCAVKKQIYKAAISSVSISSSDNRYRYKAGDLPRTLTEKLTALSKPVSLGELDGSGVLRVSQGGTGASDAASARAGLGMYRSLYNNSTGWSSGNITVKGSSEYSLFAIRTKTSSTAQLTLILAMRCGSTVRGIGGYPVNDTTQRLFSFAATCAEDTWSFGRCLVLNHISDGSHGTLSALTVTEIIGIL